MKTPVMISKKKCVCLIFFLAYIAVVLRLTVFRFNFIFDERKLNLMIFSDLIDVYRNWGINRFLWLFLGNIGWFIPFGFLVPMLLKKERFLIIIILGFLFSVTIESLQFIFRVGVAELDDLILNTIGAAIGYMFYKFAYKILSPSWRIT